MTCRQLLAALLLTISLPSFAQVWATATSTNKSDGTVIVFRYIKQFHKDFDRRKQLQRIIIVWRYQGQNGMPSRGDRVRMDELEDALEPLLTNGLSTLALVSTGNNLREWTYYARDEEEFFSGFREALKSREPYPLEVHLAPDPEWRTYKDFVLGVKP